MSRIVSARPQRTLLPAIQQVLDGAEEALLAVAFIDTRGVHLLEKELKSVGSVRMLATSQFDRQQRRTDVAFDLVTGFGVTARLLNPVGGTTFHPKMYLARRGSHFTGVIGSANLTFGLAGNFETGVILNGNPARDAWALGEQLWQHPEAHPWLAKGRVQPDELDPALYDNPRSARASGHDLQDARPKTANEQHPGFLEDRCNCRHSEFPGGAYVPARMIQIGYDALVTSPSGWLTNTELLNTLRVHRSSFVLALLAELPMVHLVSQRPITIELIGSPPAPASSQEP